MAFDNYTYGEERQKQDEEKRKHRRVYSTALINELIKERQQGYDIPYDAFFQRDLDLRAPNVTFMMTDEEVEEYQKCYDSALYYVENYCKFMTDHGMNTVELRDFQKNVVKTVTDEVYIEDLEDYGPKNRNVIWMAARQSGKCHIFNQLCKITAKTGEGPNNVSMIDIYRNNTNNIDKNSKILNTIKLFLYKIYNKLS